MKNTHCCQCGEVRPLVTPPSQGFSFDKVLQASSVRPITRQLFNEVNPQMIAMAQVYRNGGSGADTHICGLCQVAALKVIRDSIDAVIESVEWPSRPMKKESNRDG